MMIENIQQYKKEFADNYKELLDLQQNDPDSVVSDFENIDDAITIEYYNKALAKNKDLDFVDFYRNFNPTGKYSNPAAFKANYSGNENIEKESEGKIADRMYNNLTRAKDAVDLMSNINIKDYGDFIFQQVPRFVGGSGSFGDFTTPKPYTRGELTELTGSLTGREDDALPTRGMRAIMSLGLKREKALDNLQQYVYQGYQNSGGKLGKEDREVVENNKFLRQNIKTGELEFYNPKANKYQLVNTAGLDTGDVLSFTGDFIKLISETAGATLGFAGGAFGGSLINPVIGGAAALPGAYYGGKAGYYAGEIVRAGVGNLFFPGLNPEITSFNGIKEILGDEEIQNNAQVSAILAAFGPVADKMIKTIRKAVSAGRLLTKKDFSKMANDAEEAQIIADRINIGIQDSKLLQKGNSQEFYFGVGEATRDPETLMYLNNLYEHDSAFRSLMNAQDKANQKVLKNYYQTIGDTFDYANLTGKADVAPGTIVREINNIIKNRLNSAVGKEEQKILLGSKKSLDQSIAELPNQGVIVEGSYIRTAVGNAQKGLEDSFSKKFDGMMETAKDVQFDTKIIQDVFSKVKGREKQTLFKNSLPISKMFNIKPEQKTIDGKTLIQTLQDLKAFDRKVRTGAVAADISEGSVKSLIGAIQASMGATSGKAAKGVYQRYRSLNQQYYEAKKALNNTLGELTAIKNGRVKVQDSDLFETSFTARTKGYKERIDEIYEVMKLDPEHLNTYKNNILNFYRKEVIKPDGSVDLKKHEQFVSSTDKGGYGYGLKKFFGDEFNEIKKVGGLQKKVIEETEKLEVLKKNLLETSEGRLTSLNPNQVIKSLVSGEDPKYVADIMKVLGTNPKVKQKVKASMADYIRKQIVDEFGNFELQSFNKFFQSTSGYKGDLDKVIETLPHSPFDIVKQVFKDDPGYIQGLETIQKALTIMSRRKTDAIKPGTRISAAMHLLRTKVGLFTPEGRALTAVLRLTEKANQKSFATLLTNKDAVRKIAELNRIIIPKNLTDNNKIDNFLRKNKAYTQFVTQFLGDLSGIGQASTDLQEPDEMNTQEGTPVMPKPDMNEQLNFTLNRTEPNVNLFAGVTELPPAPVNQRPIEDQPQEPVVAQAPPRASGIGALNPQAQAANFAGLFPEDNLGQAIAQRGNKIG